MMNIKSDTATQTPTAGAERVSPMLASQLANLTSILMRLYQIDNSPSANPVTALAEKREALDLETSTELYTGRGGLVTLKLARDLDLNLIKLGNAVCDAKRKHNHGSDIDCIKQLCEGVSAITATTFNTISTLSGAAPELAHQRYQTVLTLGSVLLLAAAEAIHFTVGPRRQQGEIAIDIMSLLSLMQTERDAASASAASTGGTP